jgi:hypothetical protein
MTYRDDRLVVRARLDVAIGARDAAFAELKERLDALVVLNEQVARRRKQPVPLGHVPTLTPLPKDLEPLPLAEQLRLCEALEGESETLRQRVVQLGATVSLLSDRARGLEGHERLGAPPRSVPLRYILAESVTWPSAAGFVAAGVVLVSWTSAPPYSAALASGALLLALMLALLRWVGLELGLLHVFIGLAVAPFLSVFLGAFVSMLQLGIGGVVLMGGLVILANTVRAIQRRNFLERCKVAHVTLAQSKMDFGSMNNWPLAHSRGWQVTYEGYTGAGHKNTLRYLTDEGYEGELAFRGREYEGGVVLYDPSAPRRAVIVHKFLSAPRPNAEGAWSGALGAASWFRVAVWVASLAFSALALRKGF